MVQSPKPCLKVVGLHIEGLRALRRVDWPADGMGWNGQVPDLVMVGGVNGSGKTTLLDFIAGAVRLFWGYGEGLLDRYATVNASVDFLLTSSEVGTTNFRTLVGDRLFVANNGNADRRADFTRMANRWQKHFSRFLLEDIHPIVADTSAFSASTLPRVLHIPSERRLVLHNDSYKSPGSLEDNEGFYYRLSPSDEWNKSLEALLYAARWADLNAKEEGHPEKATNFDSYDKAFQSFFGETKRLTWHEGKLWVRLADSNTLHPLGDLSSGEKQALVLAAELHRRWRPGSLVLIDEPELHFHPSWQTALWTMLERLQRERGGQVIVATQSNHLFRIAESGTTVLLGGSAL